ncbi:MAG: hypothetical protein ACYSRP_03050 [Planctomycetota bacterium]|jgi:hypothetical protein
MELSILVAKIAAVFYISVGIGALSGTLKLTKIIEDFETSAGLTYMTGTMVLILGMLLVAYHNIWVKDWTVLITVIGWAMLLKGVLLITYPQYLSFFKSWYKHSWALGIFVIVLGLIFGYFGFML